MTESQLAPLVCQSLNAVHFLVLSIALFITCMGLLVIGLWVYQSTGIVDDVKAHMEQMEERYWQMTRRFVTVMEAPAQQAQNFYDRLRNRDEDLKRLREFDERLRAENLRAGNEKQRTEPSDDKSSDSFSRRPEH